MRKAAAVLLLLAACGRQEPAPPSNDAAALNAAGNFDTGDMAPVPQTNASTAVGDAPAARAALMLTGRGIEPRFTFGMARPQAMIAALSTFGEPTGREHNDECGEGSMDIVSFRGLQLAFQDDRLVGWALSEAQPPLRTAGGLAIGAPRSALGNAAVDEESSLGPEFEVAGVGGILDEHGTRIEALWAGATCQFR